MSIVFGIVGVIGAAAEGSATCFPACLKISSEISASFSCTTFSIGACSYYRDSHIVAERKLSKVTAEIAELEKKLTALEVKSTSRQQFFAASDKPKLKLQEEKMRWVLKKR